ncbi:MAG TPA: LON peptidase substrate-binding domain-containing protein [Burkholderiaceae bacterium]|nr:LON peptidase substrate-binding domain-containing protein [Burkholderiaceae bacterium]
MPAEVPIFPLNTVLFPGGVLPLRVFEARYLDMVRDCLQHDRPFGVCLIVRGQEVGAAAEHESVGCLAQIRGWDMQQLGVLQLRTVGTERFRVLERSVGANALVRATIDPIAADDALPVPQELADCAALARRIVQDIEQREPDPQRRIIEPPYEFDSASWVANRLSEVLPIPVSARQGLMALEDPLARLSLVHRFLHQHQVL